jgi:hypothetical protein
MQPITDLDDIRRLADQRRAEFERLCAQLEDDAALDGHDDAFDAQIDRLAAPIIAAIDCTQCANCCRTARVYLTIQDVARLSGALGMSPSGVIARCVERGRAAQAGEWGVLRESPCPFLRGSLCAIYPHRPDSCARYPQFTPDFRWTLRDTLDGAGKCPIIYHVLDALTQALQRVTPLEFAGGAAPT